MSLLEIFGSIATDLAMFLNDFLEGQKFYDCPKKKVAKVLMSRLAQVDFIFGLYLVNLANDG